MLYKHFIAVLAAAFLLCIGAISAQIAKENPVLPTFEQLVADDAPQAYQLAVNNKLNFEQLEFFILYELGEERNFDYIDTLHEVYWRQLTHKDKLVYERMQFIEEYAYISQPTKQPYQFTRSFAYVVEHKAEYKKVWGNSLFTQFVWDILNVDCADIGIDDIGNDVEPLNIRKQKAEQYLLLIKKQLPEYEPRTRANIYCRCVYNSNLEAKEYYNSLNKYLIKYETDPETLREYTHELVYYEKELKYKKLGINWINKAIELETDYSNVVCKAHLLYQLGRIEEAKNTLIAIQPQIEKEEEWLKAYYRETEKMINTAK